MGGGYYSQDVAREARSTTTDAFTFRGYEQPAGAASHSRKVHPDLDPHGKVRECCNTTPIVVALDVTRSRGDDSKLMYNKLPMFIGQIELKGYVKEPGISFAAIGDATVDKAPLQTGQFEADNRLDKVLSKFWIEEGGGGTGQESYELAAYFYAKTKLKVWNETGKKGYFFFVGDEGFYPEVDKKYLKEVLGEDVKASVPSAEVFRELQKRFHVFFVYPQKSWEQRKGDIDAEIKNRVEAAGGLYEGVDIRASLIWNNRNDLDLHIITPKKEEIYYAHKRSNCGGWLDVDMNVRGETTKPVENVRWKKGEAKPGQYSVIVQNYAYKEEQRGPVDYKVELEVNGEVRHFEGRISPNGETGSQSNILIDTFSYDPNARVEEVSDEKKEAYSQYDDTVILKQWASVIPAENILRIEDPRAIIDVLLGALAIVEGTTDLDGYVADLKSRNQTPERIAQVTNAIGGLMNREAVGEVLGTIPNKKRPSKTTRL